MASQTSCVRLSIVNISCTDALIQVSSFLKLSLKFRNLEKQELFRSAVVIYLFIRFDPAGQIFMALRFQLTFELLLNTENVIEEEENSDVNSV